MMKRTHCWLVMILLGCCLVGCGSEYSSVSGTITFDGEPVSNILVVFSPQANDETNNPGPVSTATSDENGNFSLRTRDGQNGAAKGIHKVGFRWADIHHSSLASLQREYQQVRKDFPEEAKQLLDKINDVKAKLSSRVQLPENLEAEFEVVDGTSDANFELSDLK